MRISMYIFNKMINWQYIVIISASLSDPYVKIYLHHDNRRLTKKKTHIKKRSLNPVFNESFVFDLPATEEDLSSLQLEFVVLDWDRVTRNEVLLYMKMLVYLFLDQIFNQHQAMNGCYCYCACTAWSIFATHCCL